MASEDHGEGTAGPRPETATGGPVSSPTCRECGRPDDHSVMFALTTKCVTCFFNHTNEGTTDG